jgi:hypothetical protein
MKKYVNRLAVIVTLSVVILVSQALGQDRPKPSKEVQKSFCTVVKTAAGTYMEAHQTGEDTTEYWDKIEDVDISEKLKEVFRAILLDAVAQPLYSSPYDREMSINKFRNYWYFTCIETFSE